MLSVPFFAVLYPKVAHFPQDAPTRFSHSFSQSVLSTFEDEDENDDEDDLVAAAPRCAFAFRGITVLIRISYPW
jgi:hypothetical protein